MAQAADKGTRTHLQRLQEIEKNVIDAVSAAAAAMEEMSNLGPPDKGKARSILVQQQCELFLAKMQAAQVLVQEGAENPVAEREFKATVYQAMSRAHMAHEKVQTVAMQVTNMLNTLQKQQP